MQISKIEGGKSVPSLDTLEAIAKNLQVEMKDLFDFQHLVAEESFENEAIRLLGMMNERDKKLAIKLLRALET